MFIAALPQFVDTENRILNNSDEENQLKITEGVLKAGTFKEFVLTGQGVFIIDSKVYGETILFDMGNNSRPQEYKFSNDNDISWPTLHYDGQNLFIIRSTLTLFEILLFDNHDFVVVFSKENSQIGNKSPQNRILIDQNCTNILVVENNGEKIFKIPIANFDQSTEYQKTFDLDNSDLRFYNSTTLIVWKAIVDELFLYNFETDFASEITLEVPADLKFISFFPIDDEMHSYSINQTSNSILLSSFDMTSQSWIGIDNFEFTVELNENNVNVKIGQLWPIISVYNYRNDGLDFEILDINKNSTETQMYYFNHDGYRILIYSHYGSWGVILIANRNDRENFNDFILLSENSYAFLPLEKSGILNKINKYVLISAIIILIWINLRKFKMRNQSNSVNYIKFD